MKKIIVPIICLVIIALAFYKSDNITTLIANKITDKPMVIIPKKNAYAKNKSYRFVQLTDDFVPYSYQDLKNIFFTTINNGWKSFTFYCPSEYENCLKDAEDLRNDKLVLSYINDFVHPYNSFASLKTSIASNGEIIITPNYLYTEEQIQEIEDIVNVLVEKYQSSKKVSMNTKEIIRYFHDYIINNTKYDVIRGQDGESEYESHIAYGTFVQHKAICNGYADAMAIILDKLNITNYKIATPASNISYADYGHIWNAAYVNGKWYHLDLTWDDTVASDGKDYLFYKYFLITTDKLKSADNGTVKIEEHNFDDNIYLEFNDLIYS